MNTTLIRNAAYIYSCDGEDRAFRNGYILVRGNQVAEIGLEPCPIEGADRIIDASGCIVTPGFVNTHHHFFQSLTRGIPSAQRAFAIDWLAGLYPLWAEIDPDAMYWASAAAAAELLLTGATTSADHSYLMPAEDGDFVLPQVRAAAETGLRLHLVRGSMPSIEGDIAERLKPLMGARLSRLQDHDDEVLPLIEAAIAAHHDTSRHAMLRIALGPTGVSYDNPAFMRKIAEVAAANDCGLHTHFHPREGERQLCRKLNGQEAHEMLRDSGWLRPGTWFAHATELQDDEIAAFADAGCGIAHCPRTIVRLGYKLTRISSMRAAGLKVGIGVDGPASNDSGSMLSEVRLAHMLHRVGSPEDIDPAQEWMSPYQTLLMATRDGAAILGRDDIGQIAVGMSADIAAFDLRDVSFVGAVTDPLAALMMCGSNSRSALTMVNGRVVVENGALVSFDEATILDQANRAARRLLETAEKNTGLNFSAVRGSGPHPKMLQAE